MRQRAERKSGVGAFSSERGTLTALRADVSIPRSHRVGEVEAPSIWRLQVEESTSRHVVITSLRDLRLDDLPSIAFGASPTRDVLFYVHRFNITFDMNIKQAGVLAYDLHWRGSIVAIDWPSAGKISNFLSDVARAEWSVTETAKLLSQFGATQSGAVSLIARDIGTRNRAAGARPFVGHPR